MKYIALLISLALAFEKPVRLTTLPEPDGSSNFKCGKIQILNDGALRATRTELCFV
jgi:hypothetical protein